MKQKYSHKVLIFLDDIYETINTKQGCLAILITIVVMFFLILSDSV